MNDHHPPLSDDDLSAVLDGLADETLAARARSEAAPRLAALAAARSTLAAATVAPLADDVVDRLVTTALRGGSELADPPGTPDPIPSIAPVHPSAPTRSGRRVPTWLVAAAVVVMMSVGVALIGTDRHGSTAKFETVGASINANDPTTEADDRAADATSAPEGAVAGQAGAPATTTAAGSTTTAAAAGSATIAVSDLGTFEDAAALRTALRTGFGPGTAATPIPSAALDRCRQQVQVTLSITADPTRTGRAKVAGREVFVYVFPYTAAGPGVTELVAGVGRDACDPVVTFQR